MCHQDHPAQSKTCEDHCSSDIAYSFEHFNHVDGDLLLTCEDLRHRKTVLVHKSRVLAMFPGLRKQFDASIKALPPNCAEITSSIVQVKEVGDSKDTKSEDGEMSDDGIIELHEGDDSTVIENIEQINLQGDKRSTDAQPVGHKPTLQEVTLSIQPEILGVMLAFVYGDVKLMDLSPHPQHIRGEVWEAAIQYRCPSLILYAESSIL